MSLSDKDIARIAKAVADEMEERKEQRRVEQAKVSLVCLDCGAIRGTRHHYACQRVGNS